MNPTDGLSALLRSAASGLLLYARQPEVEPAQLRAPPSLRSSEPPRCPVRRSVEICRGPGIQDSFFLASWRFGFEYEPLPSSPANRLVGAQHFWCLVHFLRPSPDLLLKPVRFPSAASSCRLRCVRGRCSARRDS